LGGIVLGGLIGFLTSGVFACVVHSKLHSTLDTSNALHVAPSGGRRFSVTTSEAPWAAGP